MMNVVDGWIVRERHGNAIRVIPCCSSDRVRALMLSGISEDTAKIFVYANAHRAAVVQLAQRVGLTQ